MTRQELISTVEIAAHQAAIAPRHLRQHHQNKVEAALYALDILDLIEIKKSMAKSEARRGNGETERAYRLEAIRLEKDFDYVVACIEGAK